jgi:hypothetical protein
MRKRKVNRSPLDMYPNLQERRTLLYIRAIPLESPVHLYTGLSHAFISLSDSSLQDPSEQSSKGQVVGSFIRDTCRRWTLST